MQVTWYMLLMLIGIPSIITVIVQKGIDKWITKRQKNLTDEALNKKANQALLRDRLRALYKEYMNQGWVDIDDKSNYSNMYDIYHSLGKNGVMDEMCKQVLKLPTKPPTEFKRRKSDG